MTRLKYVVIESLIRSVAIIFAREISHSKFKKLKPISAGIFGINNVGNVELLDGSDSLDIGTRHGIDEDILEQTIKGESLYLIIREDETYQETVIVLKEGYLSKEFINYLRPVSFGSINIMQKEAKQLAMHSGDFDDKKIISSFIKYGCIWDV